MKRASIVVLGLLFAFACKKPEQTTSTTQTAATTINTSTTATVSQPVTPVPATPNPTPAPAGVTVAVIASTDGERPGTHIDITELKRTSGGTVNLKFVLTNSGSEKLGMSNFLGDHLVSADYYRDMSGIHLIDPVNKKKYFVVLDAEKRCVCSKDVQDPDAGSKVNLWAKFPAPPPEVGKVTIEIPHFAPIDDVTISQ